MPYYIISGTVMKGSEYGRTIGFPTVNIDRRQFSRLKKKPALGIYAGTARVGKKQYRAGIVIGPLDTKGLPRVEAHIVEFSHMIYGQKVTLELTLFMRKFKKFTTESALVTQIKKDMRFVAQKIKV